MKLRDWAMIGVGMSSTLLYQKFASKYIEDTINKIIKEIDMIKSDIGEMMK